MIEQNNENNFGLVTQTGDIVFCNGGASCPLARCSKTESQLQAEFAANTKIWCSPGARESLEMLMAEHGFTAPRLYAAWQANSLYWDDKQSRMICKSYWIEPVFGYGIVAVMVFYFVLQGWEILNSPAANSWQGGLAFAISIVVNLGSAWMAHRFVLHPYRIARKVKQALRQPTKLSPQGGPALTTI